ncbi:MAG: ABC transporter substrate-binding protein [Gammaproteobacteria bacterium]
MIKFKSFWLAGWFFVNLLTAQGVFAETAREVVEKFQAQLIEVMEHGKELGYQGRYDKLAEAVASSHDLIKIARIVIGKEWEDLSEEQQRKWIDAFSRLSIASYAYNFKDYSGESFRFDSQEETGRGGVIVHSYLVVPHEKEVRFDYMMKQKGDTWLINNIIANGVSDLALKRSEYGSILKREGFDALIAKINDKIIQYSKN